MHQASCATLPGTSLKHLQDVSIYFFASLTFYCRLKHFLILPASGKLLSVDWSINKPGYAQIGSRMISTGIIYFPTLSFVSVVLLPYLSLPSHIHLQAGEIQCLLSIFIPSTLLSSSPHTLLMSVPQNLNLFLLNIQYFTIWDTFHTQLKNKQFSLWLLFHSCLQISYPHNDRQQMTT